MGLTQRIANGYERTSYFAGLTTSGANETAKWIEASGISGTLLQNKFLTQYCSVAETWVPVGVLWIPTTGITTTAPTLILRKNGVSPATGGVATLAIQATSANEFFSAFTPWTFAAADAAAQQWSVLVGTTSAAGQISAALVYQVRMVTGIEE